MIKAILHETVALCSSIDLWEKFVNNWALRWQPVVNEGCKEGVQRLSCHRHDDETAEKLLLLLLLLTKYWLKWRLIKLLQGHFT